MGAYPSQLEQQQPELIPPLQYSQPQLQLQPQPHPQPQSQQHQQPQPHEASSGREVRSMSRREIWSFSPLDEGDHNTKSPSTTTLAVQNPPPLKANKELIFPHNYEHILKNADSPVHKSSREKLYDQLYDGVFLDHKTKKYWLEKKSNGNCFMLYARALSITWADNQNYWNWVLQKDASGTMTEVAELKTVCWLEVHGKFDTRKLTPGILYQVTFIVMLKDPAQGWELPVNVRLTLPGGKKQQHKEKLMEKLRGRWIEIPVGEFVASEKDVGEMEISLFEYEGGMWKQGLVIKGVAIKPKN